MCGGSAQTPINLVDKDAVTIFDDGKLPAAPVFAASGNGGCQKWIQFANDHVFEVSFVEAGCSNLSLTFNGTTYTLLQLHFHSWSEHTIDGLGADAEVRRSFAGRKQHMSTTIVHSLFLSRYL
jgi:carbonic anhydrase